MNRGHLGAVGAFAIVLAACGGRSCGAPRSHDAGALADTCVGPKIPIAGDTPTLYFVVDHSGSMREHDKWNSVRSAVQRIMTELGPSARFGATMFPAPRGGCEPGTETLSLRLGDTTGEAASALPTEAEAVPAGGTPAAATLRALLPDLVRAPKPTFVVLATDGGPNCNPAIRCGASDCTANLEHLDPMCTPSENCCEPDTAFGPKDCLDGAATVDAVAKLKAAGIPTYVIGIHGSEPYERVLAALARAGGTARPSPPSYYRAESDDVAAIAAIFERVAAKITASCGIELARPPPRPAEVRVFLGGVRVPGGPNGFALQGSTLTLLGSSCERALSGQSLGLTIGEGCP